MVVGPFPHSPAYRWYRLCSSRCHVYCLLALGSVDSVNPEVSLWELTVLQEAAVGQIFVIAFSATEKGTKRRGVCGQVVGRAPPKCQFLPSPSQLHTPAHKGTHICSGGTCSFSETQEKVLFLCPVLCGFPVLGAARTVVRNVGSLTCSPFSESRAGCIGSIPEPLLHVTSGTLRKTGMLKTAGFELGLSKSKRGSNPSPPFQLCNPGQITSLLPASVSSSVQNRWLFSDGVSGDSMRYMEDAQAGPGVRCPG